MNKFDSPEYKRSRKAIIVQSMADYLASLLVIDAYIAQLLSSIGISDSLIGIISSFVSLAFIIELASIFIARKNVGAKKTVILCHTASILLFMLLYLIPFMPAGKGTKTALAVLGILFAYGLKYIVSSIRFKWTNSFISPKGRGIFSATNEIVSLSSGMIFTAVAGFVVDKFISLDNLNGAFLFIAAALMILNVCNLISYIFVKKDIPDDSSKESVPMSEIYENTLKKPGYKKVLIFTILWKVAIYFTVGFLGIFKTKDLMMSMVTIQVISIVSSLARIAVSSKFGRYSDRHSCEEGMKLALYFAAAAFFINIFTTADTWFFIILFSLLFHCSDAGLVANSTNVLFRHVDIKYISYAVAVKNCIGGICGFLASVAGGVIMEFIQSHDNMIFGVHIYGQQVLSAITFILLVVTIIFLDRALIRKDTPEV